MVQAITNQRGKMEHALEKWKKYAWSWEKTQCLILSMGVKMDSFIILDLTWIYIQDLIQSLILIEQTKYKIFWFKLSRTKTQSWENTQGLIPTTRVKLDSYITLDLTWIYIYIHIGSNPKLDPYHGGWKLIHRSCLISRGHEY